MKDHYCWKVQELKIEFAGSRTNRTLVIIEKTIETKHSNIINIF